MNFLWLKAPAELFKVLITSANVIEPLLVQECGAGRNVLTPISPQRDEKGRHALGSGTNTPIGTI